MDIPASNPMNLPVLTRLNRYIPVCGRKLLFFLIPQKSKKRSANSSAQTAFKFTERSFYW
jgi:hypothetical protein